jgi:hypothetical protein
VIPSAEIVRQDIDALMEFSWWLSASLRDRANTKPCRNPPPSNARVHRNDGRDSGLRKRGGDSQAAGLRLPSSSSVRQLQRSRNGSLQPVTEIDFARKTLARRVMRGFSQTAEIAFQACKIGVSAIQSPATR